MPLTCARTWLWFVLAGLCTTLATAQPSPAADYLTRAHSAMENGRFARAVSLLSDGINATDEPALDALYLRGIALGERGKHPTMQSGIARFLDRAQADFNAILARDSLYRDVLYQSAILRQYVDDFEGAIRLGEEQLQLRPEHVEAHVGLFKIYSRYVLETDPAEARRVLREIGGNRAQLFVGYTFARQGLHYAADDIFLALEENQKEVPLVAVLLARARLAFGRSDPVAGSSYVKKAIDSIVSAVDAHILFEEIRTIVSPVETDEFHAAQDDAGWRRFFESFWAKRDPMPAAPYNARMAEHYRRLRVADRDYLFHGYRSWYRSPFTYRKDIFPATYELGHDYDDRGVTFIRHGEPDDYTVGEAQSWLYEDSLMIFHFAPTCIREICSVTTHFTPVPKGSTYGPRFVGLDPLDALRKSAEYIMRGLTTDRHRWPDKTEVVSIPHVLAAFRGLDDRTLLEVYYTIPVEEFGPESNSVRVEVGLALHDEAWLQHALYRENKDLGVERSFTGRIQVDVLPLDYRLAFHVRSLTTSHLGTHTEKYRPPRFDYPGLKLSDILLADTVHTPPGLVRPTRQDLTVEVNPLHRFTLARGFFLVFEIYDLELASSGRTRYSVSYTLRPIDRRGDVQDEGAITLEDRLHEGSAPTVVEFVAIDVRDVPRGTYELSVTVRDFLGEADAVRTRTVHLER